MGKTILLVEDNPDDVALAEAAFAKVAPHHRLVIAEDGEAAVEHLRAVDGAGLGAPPPALLLLDLKLRGIDGFEVLRRLRADARGTLVPVVVLTSSVEERDVVTSYQLGANSYVRKPVDFDEFVGLMELLVHYWLDLNEPVPEARP